MNSPLLMIPGDLLPIVVPVLKFSAAALRSTQGVGWGGLISSVSGAGGR